MKKGEIFYGRKHSDAIHPIVFIKDRDVDFFVGAMLTSSNLFSNNILMSIEHIKTKDKTGRNFEFQYQNTHFVKAKLIKRKEWMPFRKIGELTKSGIEFIEYNIHDKPEIFWEDYIGI